MASYSRLLVLALLAFLVHDSEGRAIFNVSEGSGGELQFDSAIDCSGYERGDPEITVQLNGCKTGSDIGVVGHMYAFGFQDHWENPNWMACALPQMPETK